MQSEHIGNTVKLLTCKIRPFDIFTKRKREKKIKICNMWKKIVVEKMLSPTRGESPFLGTLNENDNFTYSQADEK
jgi:hypothetical protein